MLPPPAPEVVIHRDLGGSIAQYQWAAWKLRYFGAGVRINGVCVSACTAVLIVPAERICVTRRAELWFHEASAPVPGHPRRRQRSESGTEQMLRWYPPAVQEFIARHGGLTREWVKLRGAALRRLFRLCR